MNNVEMTVSQEGILTLVIDLNQSLGASKTGKSVVVASTLGNVRLPGRLEKVGVNVFKPLDEAR